MMIPPEDLDRLIHAMQLHGVRQLRWKDDGRELRLVLPPAPVLISPAEALPVPAATDVPDEALAIRSHTVGRFYSTQTADELPPLLPGDRIRQGQKICMIEAMNLEHVIKAPVDGVLLEVRVDDGDAVEYGQLLMRVRPQASGELPHVS